MSDSVHQPAWLWDLLGAPCPAEASSVSVVGQQLTLVSGVPRAEKFVSAEQGQIRDAFGFKWAKRDSFEGGVTGYMQTWLAEKYGDLSNAPWLAENGPNSVVLDEEAGITIIAKKAG